MYLDNESFVPQVSKIEQKKKLKPSEALRIGLVIRPQCTGALFMDGKSCALGAIAEGSGVLLYDSVCGEIEQKYSKIYQSFPELLKNNIFQHIIALNDGGFSREYIANWLESRGL